MRLVLIFTHHTPHNHPGTHPVPLCLCCHSLMMTLLSIFSPTLWSQIAQRLQEEAISYSQPSFLFLCSNLLRRSACACGAKKRLLHLSSTTNERQVEGRWSLGRRAGAQVAGMPSRQCCSLKLSAVWSSRSVSAHVLASGGGYGMWSTSLQRSLPYYQSLQHRTRPHAQLIATSLAH